MSIHVPGGLQGIVTLKGYITPLTIKDGLSRLEIWPHIDIEFDTLPHVHLTSELEWDQSALDHTFQDESEWGDATIFPHGTLDESLLDELVNIVAELW
jgi:hypothetical protein